MHQNKTCLVFKNIWFVVGQQLPDVSRSATVSFREAPRVSGSLRVTPAAIRETPPKMTCGSQGPMELCVNCHMLVRELNKYSRIGTLKKKSILSEIMTIPCNVSVYLSKSNYFQIIVKQMSQIRDFTLPGYLLKMEPP